MGHLYEFMDNSDKMFEPGTDSLEEEEELLIQNSLVDVSEC